jgi:hypothetical protein
VVIHVARGNKLNKKRCVDLRETKTVEAGLAQCGRDELGVEAARKVEEGSCVGGRRRRANWGVGAACERRQRVMAAAMREEPA